MRVPKSLFIIYCLILTNVLAASYATFVEYFQSGYEIKGQIHRLESKIKNLDTQKKVVENRLIDLEQTVAEVLPSQSKMIADRWDTRSVALSQQLRSPASLHPINLSQAVFERGKKYFSQGKYNLAFREFENVREKYPTSDRVVESTFLMLESSFLLKDFKKTADLADFMVTQYPDNPLTGYGLMRLAQVSELNNQFDEAAALYRIVADNFSDQKLKEQAVIFEKRILVQ